MKYLWQKRYDGKIFEIRKNFRISQNEYLHSSYCSISLLCRKITNQCNDHLIINQSKSKTSTKYLIS